MKAVATVANEQSTEAEDALRLIVDTTPALGWPGRQRSSATEPASMLVVFVA